MRAVFRFFAVSSTVYALVFQPAQQPASFLQVQQGGEGESLDAASVRTLPPLDVGAVSVLPREAGTPRSGGGGESSLASSDKAAELEAWATFNRVGYQGSEQQEQQDENEEQVHVHVFVEDAQSNPQQQPEEARSANAAPPPSLNGEALDNREESATRSGGSFSAEISIEGDDGVQRHSAETFSRNLAIGLKNTGNSCYVNSILQCLAFSPTFLQFFRSQEVLAHVAACTEEPATCLLCGFRNFLAAYSRHQNTKEGDGQAPAYRFVPKTEAFQVFRNGVSWPEMEDEDDQSAFSYFSFSRSQQESNYFKAALTFHKYLFANDLCATELWMI